MTICTGRSGSDKQSSQAFLVAEDEVGALVGREAPGEADGHRLRVERSRHLAQLVRRLAVARELARQPAAR